MCKTLRDDIINSVNNIRYIPNVREGKCMKKKRGGQKKRRGMGLLLILSMIVLALSGCSKKKETKTEKPPTKKIEVEKPEMRDKE